MKNLFTLLVVMLFCAPLSIGQTTPKVYDVENVTEVTMLGTTPKWTQSTGLSSNAVYVYCSNKLFAVDNSKIYSFDLNGTATAVELADSKGKCLASNGSQLFQISDNGSSLFVINPADGVAKETNLSSSVNTPSFISASGNYVFAVSGNQISKIDVANGNVSTSALNEFTGNVFISAIDADNVFVSCPAKAGVYNFTSKNFTSTDLSTASAEVEAGRGINTAIGGYCEVTVGNHNIRLFPSGANSEMFSGYNSTNNGTVNYYYAGGVKPSANNAGGNAINYIFYNNGLVYQVCPAASNAIRCYSLEVLNSVELFAQPNITPIETPKGLYECELVIEPWWNNMPPVIKGMKGIIKFDDESSKIDDKFKDNMSIIGYGAYIREHTEYYAPGIHPQPIHPIKPGEVSISEVNSRIKAAQKRIKAAEKEEYPAVLEEFIANPLKTCGVNEKDIKQQGGNFYERCKMLNYYCYHDVKEGDRFVFENMRVPKVRMDALGYPHYDIKFVAYGPYKVEGYIFYNWYGQVNFKSAAKVYPFEPDYDIPAPEDFYPTIKIKSIYAPGEKVIYNVLDFSKMDNSTVPLSQYSCYKVLDEYVLAELKANGLGEFESVEKDFTNRYSFFVQDGKDNRDAHILQEVGANYNFKARENIGAYQEKIPENMREDFPFVICHYAKVPESIYNSKVGTLTVNEKIKLCQSLFGYAIYPVYSKDYPWTYKSYHDTDYSVFIKPESSGGVITGVEEVDVNDEVKVFPTLVDDQITVVSPVMIENIDIYSISGALVKHFDECGEAEINEPVDDLAQGTYFVKVNNSKVIKIVKR